MPSDKTLVHFVIDDDLLAAVEAYRRDLSKIPSRSKAIKDLLREALTAHGYLAADPPPAPDERTG